MEFEAWVEGKGFVMGDLSDVQVSALRAAWRAEMNPVPLPVPNPGAGGNPPRVEPSDLDEVLARQRAEQARQQRITVMVGEAAEEHPGRIDELEQIGRAAIKGKWTEQQTELAILRACRASAPLPLRSGGNSPVVNERVLECALASAAGLRAEGAGYDERTLEAAHRTYRGGLGLHQLLHTVAVQNGYRGHAPVKSNLAEVMRHAFNLSPRASGVSTISISGILSNVANKFMREAFMSVDMTWSEIASRRSVSDFKTITSYSLSGDMTYEEIAPGGKLKHGTAGETTYTNQAKSYGKMLGLDRRDLINDDLGALGTVSRRLGRGGALKLNNVFWAVFLDNSTFFASGNSNVSTGAGSALALAGLDAADVVFRAQTDPDGNLMGTLPKILLVPTALRATGWNLMNGTITIATGVDNTGTPLTTPNGNAFAGMFRLASSPYMQNSSFTGYSAAAWYLLADPNDVPVIEVAFLNGVELPTVESADADFDQLGIQLRGYHDWGVSLQEYRGGVRSAGS